MTVPRPRKASDRELRTWTCDRCGFQFLSTRHTRNPAIDLLCAECKKANPPHTGPRSNDQLAYILAKECTELRCAMQHALAALSIGRPREAKAALEAVIGPPVWMYRPLD